MQPLRDQVTRVRSPCPLAPVHCPIAGFGVTLMSGSESEEPPLINKGAPGTTGLHAAGLPVESSSCGHLTEARENCKRRRLRVKSALSGDHRQDDCWDLEGDFEPSPAKEASHQNASPKKTSPKKIMGTSPKKVAAAKRATLPMKVESPKAVAASPISTPTASAR